MYHFKEMRDQLIKQAQTKKAVVAVAAAGDLPVLQTVKMMNDYGFGTAILVGDAAKIEYFARETGCNLEENTVVDIKDESQAANVAVGLARNDAADIVMKGLLQTKTYLKAIPKISALSQYPLLRRPTGPAVRPTRPPCIHY